MGLLHSIETAFKGSRDLDIAIAVTIDGFFEIAPRFEGDEVGYGYVKDGQTITPGHGGDQLVPNYTTSLDAALRLLGRVLPGYDYMLEHTNGGLTISCLLGTNDPDQRVFANTLPLALVAAVLRTKSKQEPRP